MTEAYHNSSTITVGKWSITFGTPLTLQLEQTTITMEVWLLQYQAGQKQLANILTQERRNRAPLPDFSYPAPEVVIQTNHPARQTNIPTTLWFSS